MQNVSGIDRGEVREDRRERTGVRGGRRMIGGRIRAHDGDGSGHPSVSHVAGPGETGLVVVDVWDSPESFAEFARDQIGPAGELPPLEPTFAPVHNHLRR